MSIANTYIQYGVPSNWATDYEQKGISANTFKNTPKKDLISKYNISAVQIKMVKECLVRQPIDESVVQKLLERNRYVCCLCKGQKGSAFIIHHIIEYSKTKDNKYSNLAVLCLNDHELAHRSLTGVSLAIKITAKYIRESKKNWEEEVIKENKKKATAKLPTPNDWKKINPYKELQSYNESDKDYFFGRKEEIKEILEKLRKHNIVGLFGESGTGKTSLLNAGLIPVLKEEGFVVVSVRCLDEPIKRTREALVKTLKTNGFPEQSIEDIAATDNFPHLIIQLKEILEKENKNLIIIIDQFEELFTRARKEEREQLSKGITESLVISTKSKKIHFLISLREDYIGELWSWSHKYKIEDAWIHQYRINRFNEEKAYEVITEPLHKLGIATNEIFIRQLISELKTIGDDLIYPPYLQIACSELFEEYKIQNTTPKPSIEFGNNLYVNSANAESIIADYLSDSIMQGLTEEEKIHTQNILDLLTGSEGLRAFLNVEEICRYLSLAPDNTQHIIEHLIKKKIVHPVVESDSVIGYELVHDFLSKKFFEKLSPEVKKSKTTIEIFRKAFKEWEQHQVLASKDRLKILFDDYKQLTLNDEEWKFILKSSFSVYWHHENKWVTIVEKEKLMSICISLLKDKDERIVEHSIDTLGKIKDEQVTPILKEILESPESSDTIKEAAIRQFWFNINDERILESLKRIIKTAKNFKLRKGAIYAFGKSINHLSKSNPDIIVDKEILVLLDALGDPMTQVRKQVADVLSYTLIHKEAVKPLIARLKIESSVSSRKAIVSALCALQRKGESKELIYPLLKKISSNTKEDYRVREEAKHAL